MASALPAQARAEGERARRAHVCLRDRRVLPEIDWSWFLQRRLLTFPK
jgi:hypothetical protein